MRTTQNGLAHYAQVTPQRPAVIHASLVESELSFTEEFQPTIFTFFGIGNLFFSIFLNMLNICFLNLEVNRLFRERKWYRR
jgi:hypothetical protein